MPGRGPQKPSPRRREAPSVSAGEWQPRSPRPSAEAEAKHRAALRGLRPAWWRLVGVAILLGPLWLAYKLGARLLLAGVLFLALLFGVAWVTSNCLVVDTESIFEDGR